VVGVRQDTNMLVRLCTNVKRSTTDLGLNAAKQSSIKATDVVLNRRVIKVGGHATQICINTYRFRRR